MIYNFPSMLAEIDAVSAWGVADNAVAFVFSLFTAGVLTYFTWKVMNSFLDLFVGRGIAFIGAIFSAILVMSAGLKVSAGFLERARYIYILQGVISGVVNTINACFAPHAMSPVEFIIMVSFGLYICYWLHTRFVPKHTIGDLKRRIERAIDDEDDKKGDYPV